VTGRLLIGAALLTSLSGCSDLTDARRWSSARNEPGDGSHVDVRFYAAPAPQAAGSPPLQGLSDQAQGAYVTGMARLATTPAALRAEVAAPLSPAAAEREGQPAIDRVPRLLVVTLSRPGGYQAGDRIIRAVIHVLPRNFSFGGYSVAQSDRRTVDITQVTRAASGEASLTIGAGPPLIPVTAEGRGTVSRRTETVTRVEESVEQLTVDVIPACMRIVQEGARNTDLTGNVRIQATLLTEVQSEPCRFPRPAAAGAPPTRTMASPLDVHVIGPDLRFVGGVPTLHAARLPGTDRSYSQEPLVADVSVEYVLRRINYGQEYYTEGLQSVTLIHGTRVEPCQTVLSTSQFLPPLYVVAAADGREVRSTRPQARTLAYTDFATANAMAAWIRTRQPTSLGGLTLEYPRGVPVQPIAYRPLFRALDGAGCPVHSVGNMGSAPERDAGNRPTSATTSTTALSREE
jgi:hypothetical protein